jgi:uncharacterized protein (DUF362 family)
MVRLSRREFLKATLSGVSVLTLEALLAACNPKPITEIPTEIDSFSPVPPTSTEKPTENIPPTLEIQTSEPIKTEISYPSETPTIESYTGKPDLVIARNGEPEEMIRRALAALGDMTAFIPQGASVVIKPNICTAYHSYEYAATTNPWLVGALVKLCFEAGARSVHVMDYPFGGTQKEAYNVSGIMEQVKASGGEMVYMPGFKYVDVAIPQGIDLKQTSVFDEILETDVLIDVPIAKHHNSAGLTLGMKNLMGVIKDRGTIHLNIGQRIADLTSLIKPQLIVVDATRILMDHGPTGGDLNDVKQLNTLVVSTDIVAADSYATTFFGKQPEDIAYIPAAEAMGLGRSDISNMKIEEIDVSG